MTEPKNSIIKQYQALFLMDNVQLEFEQGALEAVAELAIKRKTGARGLRAIIEDILTDLMFGVPSDETINKITITAEAVNGGKAKITHAKKAI